MINIVDMQKSFVLAWVTKLMQPEFEKWKTLPRYFFWVNIYIVSNPGPP